MDPIRRYKFLPLARYKNLCRNTAKLEILPIYDKVHRANCNDKL